MRPKQAYHEGMADWREVLRNIDPLGEKYRWCIYCKADCWPEKENQQHADDCPQMTGLYPVDQRMLDNQVRCGYGEDGCGYVFQSGDIYTMTEVEHRGPHTFGTVSCIECAMRETFGEVETDG
jgi:hypothetical protein